MTSRGYLQWELVGEGADPVPASGYDVRQVAKEFSDQGAQMEDAARLLRQISNLSGWTGKAATQLADKAQDTHGDLDKAASKYVDAGTALTSFADHVETARSETAAAVADAVEAEARRKSNSGNLLDGVADPTPEQITAQEERGEALEAANTAMTAARKRLTDALDILDSKAEQAAEAIRSASDNFKDSTMDDIKGAVSSALAVIVDALNVLAVIIAVVVVVLLIIGTGGTFLAFLLAISPWLGAAIFALTTVQFLMGDKGVGDVILSAFGVFGGVALVRGAAHATRTVAAVRAAQAVRVGSQARSNLSPLVRLARRIPFAPVRNWALRVGDDAAAHAVRAFQAPLDQLSSTSRLVRGLQLDELVVARRQVNHLRTLDITPAMHHSLDSAQRALRIATTGAGAQGVSQGADLLGFPEALSNTVGNIADGLDLLAAHPPTGPVSQPLGVHVSGAGR